jgi:ribonuclease HI
VATRELVVEADGASRGNPGDASYGALVRDAGTGELLAERAAAIGYATNNVAEYQGLVNGLTAARQIDPEATVEVRMDSKLVVEQMSGRWQIRHPDLRPLATQARRLFRPGQVRYTWVPREHNKHADRLANEALDAAARGERWTERPPASAHEPPPRTPREPANPGHSGPPVRAAQVTQPALWG